MLNQELLAFVHEHLGAPHATFAAPPAHLTGGFFTENHAFALHDAPPPLERELVVRLFPSATPPDLPVREAAAQTTLGDQGYPVPKVVAFDPDARLLGRRFFIMERLPGAALLGGVTIGQIVRSTVWMMRRLPRVTATLQAELHALDPSPYVAALNGIPAGIERWFDYMDDSIGTGADCLEPGRRWLVEHRPSPDAPAVICHGDLWLGNVLAVRRHVTGVIDWSVVTVAEPSFEVGFTAMSLSLAPIDGPPTVQRIARRLGRWLSARYARQYVRRTGANLAHQPYYEALRCVMELTGVVRYRLNLQQGVDRDPLRPAWDPFGDLLIAYFRERTGVTLALPD